MYSISLLVMYSSLFAKYSPGDRPSSYALNLPTSAVLFTACKIYSPGDLPVANGADEYDDADQVASAVPVHRNGNF